MGALEILFIIIINIIIIIIIITKMSLTQVVGRTGGNCMGVKLGLRHVKG